MQTFGKIPFLTRAATLIDVELSERLSNLQRKIEQTTSEFVGGGVHGAHHYLAITNLFRSEFKAIASMIWNTMARDHKASGANLTNDLRENLRSDYEVHISRAFKELEDRLRDEIVGAPTTYNHLNLSLVDCLKQSLQRYRTEIDLYVNALEQNKKQESKVDVASGKQKGKAPKRTNALSRLARKTYAELLKQGIPPSNAYVISMLESFDSIPRTIELIDHRKGVIYWHDDRGEINETTFDAFEGRMTRIRQSYPT